MSPEHDELADDALERIIQAMPKTETHLHIEGALSLDLLREWKPEQYAEPPHFRAPGFRFASFNEFDSALLSHAVPFLDSAERYHETAKALFETHVAANVRYVELSFHLPIAGFLSIPATQIRDAIRAAVPEGLEVRIFAGMLRTDYAGDMIATIDGLADWDDLAGVDLHGDEAVPNEPWTAEVWGRLRAAGKVTKAHAGEFDGAARVLEAIEVLGVTRIQHGVRAIEDPEVIALAAERGIIFDMCPISNQRLGVTPDLTSHPLPDLLAAGLRCTVSTDDPFIFPGDMNAVYRALVRDIGMDAEGLRAVATHGFRTALADEDQRARWLAELDAVLPSS